MAYRFTTVVILLLLAFTYLGFHLYQLQLVKGGYYYAQAESEQSASASNNADRGAIYFTDNNGNTLPAAIDQPFPVIYAVPTAVKNPAGHCGHLCSDPWHVCLDAEIYFFPSRRSI